MGFGCLESNSRYKETPLLPSPTKVAFKISSSMGGIFCFLPVNSESMRGDAEGDDEEDDDMFEDNLDGVFKFGDETGDGSFEVAGDELGECVREEGLF